MSLPEGPKLAQSTASQSCWHGCALSYRVSSSVQWSGTLTGFLKVLLSSWPKQTWKTGWVSNYHFHLPALFGVMEWRHILRKRSRFHLYCTLHLTPKSCNRDKLWLDRSSAASRDEMAASAASGDRRQVGITLTHYSCFNNWPNLHIILKLKTHIKHTEIYPTP